MKLTIVYNRYKWIVARRVAAVSLPEHHAVGQPRACANKRPSALCTVHCTPPPVAGRAATLLDRRARSPCGRRWPEHSCLGQPRDARVPALLGLGEPIQRTACRAGGIPIPIPATVHCRRPCRDLWNTLEKYNVEKFKKLSKPVLISRLGLFRTVDGKTKNRMFCCTHVC